MCRRSTTRTLGAFFNTLFILILGCGERLEMASEKEGQLISYSHSSTCVPDTKTDSAEVEIVLEGLEIGGGAIRALRSAVP